MAEPTNTPVPASTPRSTSPAPRQTPIIPNFPNFPSMSSPGSPVLPTKLAPGGRPKVLHIGDPIKYNPDTYALFSAQCDIVRPSAEERERPEFIRALKEHRWGDFHAIFRPFWGTGGEMGLWDSELVDLLPPTVRVFASAGAGFDWADTKLLGERAIQGIIYCNSGLAAAEAVADFAVAMIISTFRQLAWCINAAQSDDPADFSSCHRDATAQARNLRGNVLGVIGLGNIGQQVASRCHHGFGMVIHYYDVVRLPAAPNVHPRLRELARKGKVMITCHNAGGTVDTHKGFEELSMRNIMAVLAGGKAITPVNMRFLKS
uniref:D-isomer specific 2-hydroxyacid dehydrogenase NAD-binding domain-containing protein n=1 Tax=Bionectria ochroleuca TaxID=29856 RepID=A0A0B7K2F0_BIOOC